tara:strand:- start:283 stop:408 length:126 start_codon:yes stop_codon:yes gene_type:complete
MTEEKELIKLSDNLIYNYDKKKYSFLSYRESNQEWHKKNKS